VGNIIIPKTLPAASVDMADYVDVIDASDGIVVASSDQVIPEAISREVGLEYKYV